MIWVVAGILVGCVALVHMARPMFERAQISSARFFHDLPAPPKGQRRLRWGPPPLSWALLLRCLMLGVLITALFLRYENWQQEVVDEQMQLDLWVDTSSSMSTKQQDGTRFELLKKRAAQLLSEAEAHHDALRVSLYSFDMEVRTLAEKQTHQRVMDKLETLSERPLGTHLDLIRHLSQLPATGEQRRMTLIISDMPAPDWARNGENQRLIWETVGSPVGNLGFTDIKAVGDPITGVIREVHFEVTAFGAAPADLSLLITGPDGKLISRSNPRWDADQRWRGAFAPEHEGPYTLKISPGGAYGADDTLALMIPGRWHMRVDWQARDASFARFLDWEKGVTSPHLRIADTFDTVDETPTIIVGNRATRPAPIGFFREGHDLLADLLFDTVERSEQLSRTNLPDSFFPLLVANDGQAWIGYRESPRAVYVPGPPSLGPDSGERLRTVAFFNAVKWLIQDRAFTEICPRTAPGQLGTSFNPLHPGEGNTTREVRSAGSGISLEKTAIHLTKVQPIWPVLLLVFCCLLVLERWFALRRGAQWN